MAARGGRRAGTPGKSYSNRTDLNVARAPQVGTQTAAAGGVAAPTPAAAPPQPAYKTPDQVPSLTDPTARPDEPLTAGLPYGPGPGPEAIGPVPLNPDLATIQAAYLAHPTPELRRAIMLLSVKPGGFNG